MNRGAWLALMLSACGPAAERAAPASAATPAPPPPAAPSAPAVSPAAPEPAPASPSATTPAVSGKKSARCNSDDDCALRAEHHCCGTCPVVPITAVSAAAEEAARKKESEHCAREDHDCGRFECRGLPRGCQIRAVCEAGWCAPALNQACQG